MKSKDLIFISYAREDLSIAENIYAELRSSGFNPWLDRECLKPGQKWKVEIIDVIRKCAYFIAILSSKSASKKGYVQKELREALDVLAEFPDQQIFLIPVRIDDCKPTHQILHDLHWLDLFPSYEKGLKILKELLLSEIFDEPSWGPFTHRDNLDNQGRPQISIYATSPADPTRTIKFNGIIDTGAVMSCIPHHLLSVLDDSTLNYSLRKVQGPFGGIRSMKSYFLNLRIGNIEFNQIEVLPIKKEYGFIGWDILKKCTYVFDGPKSEIRIWKI